MTSAPLRCACLHMWLREFIENLITFHPKEALKKSTRICVSAPAPSPSGGRHASGGRYPAQRRRRHEGGRRARGAGAGAGAGAGQAVSARRGAAGTKWRPRAPHGWGPARVYVWWGYRYPRGLSALRDAPWVLQEGGHRSVGQGVSGGLVGALSPCRSVLRW